MSNEPKDTEEFVYECKDHIASDNDSDETIEPSSDPEPEPEDPEPVALKEEPKEHPKKRGRKRLTDVEKAERKLARDKLKSQSDTHLSEKVIVMTQQPSGINDLGKLSKNELVRLVRNQELAKVDDAKKVVTRTGVVKVKKERSEAQKAATARLVEANRIRKIARDEARAKDEESKMENIKDHIKTSIKDTIVDVINKPARSLTPERMAKVKKLENVEVEKYGFFG